MVVLYIHRASQLIERAGDTFEEQAVIMSFEKQVYIVATDVLEEELKKYSVLLNCGYQDHWIVDGSNGAQVVEAPPPHTIPKVCVTRGLGNQRTVYRGDAEFKAPLTYFVVIQGKDAAERSKVVAKHSVAAISAVMMHEAINGYSIVFSGAVLRDDGLRIFARRPVRQNWDFVRVNKESKLSVRKTLDGPSQVIPVLC